MDLVYFRRSSYKHFLLLLCMVNLPNQTSSNGIEDALKELQNQILGRLGDLDNRMASMETKMNQIDSIHVKEKVGNIEGKVVKIESEIISLGHILSQSQTTIAKAMKENIKEVKAIKSPVRKTKAKGVAILKQLILIKQERRLCDTTINSLAASNSQMSTKLNTVDYESKQYIASLKVPLEEISTHINITQKYIKLLNEDVYVSNAKMNNISQRNSELNQEINSLKYAFVKIQSQLVNQQHSTKLDTRDQTLKSGFSMISDSITSNPREFTIDIETFIVLNEHKGVTWKKAQDLCKKEGNHKLAEPQIDVTRLAAYLNTNYGSELYWLGGKGQGSKIAYMSGEEIQSNSPLWRSAQSGLQRSSNYCMYIRDNGNPNPLGTWSCQDTTYMTPLCEVKGRTPPTSNPSDWLFTS